MANLPQPRTYEELLGDMLATYTSKIGINDLNTGGVMLSFFEAVAQILYRVSGDTFSILREFSVDRATSDALQRIAKEERVNLRSASVATGKVTVQDTSFTKLSTKIYAGGAVPNIGTTKILVSEASSDDGWTSTGSIYIGRGTTNVEGPIPYTAITAVGSYYEITLSQPTAKFHNLSESVILAQGGVRTVPTGTLVRTLGTGAFAGVSFVTTQQAIILDGETEMANVPIAASSPGSSSNIPRNAIQEFATTPFTGATVTNPSPITNGQDKETDEELRNKIKRARMSRGLGTKQAILNATINAYSEEDNSTVTSNEIFSADQTVLYIDNGQGYEESYDGVGLEYIVDSALGGETNFQLATGGQQTSVVKAFLETAETSPYDLYPNDKLAILVGGISYEHEFSDGDFISNGSASAYEVVASINANPNIDFNARTIENGTKIIIKANSESNEYIQKTTPSSGVDAGSALGLNTVEAETVKLYKNKELLSRNGRSAIIESEVQSAWSTAIASGETLIVNVDDTHSHNYTITDADFLQEGTHATVSSSNTPEAWANVLNAKVVGMTTTVNGSILTLASNLGTDDRASLEIDPSSSLVSKNMFTAAKGLKAVGKDADFVLSRNTAQLKLNSPLQAGDNLTAGTQYTRGEMSTASLAGNVTFTADAELWFAVDNNAATIVNNGVVKNSFITVSKETGDILRYASNQDNAFSSVSEGDYVIAWSKELSLGNRLEGRVYSVGSSGTLTNNYLEIRVSDVEWQAAVAESVQYIDGFVTMTTTVAPQKLSLAAGTYTLVDLAAYINDNMEGIEAAVVGDAVVNIRSKRYATTGGMMLATQNESAIPLKLTSGEASKIQSASSHVAYQEASESDANFPMFAHAAVTTEDDGTVTTINSSIDLSSYIDEAAGKVCFLNPYASDGSNFIGDAQPLGLCSSVLSAVGTAITISDNPTVKRIRIHDADNSLGALKDPLRRDRFFLVSPLNLSYNDEINVVIDNNLSENVFPIPLFRTATANATKPGNAIEFRAYDTSSGATAEFKDAFGDDFDFSGYKAYMKSRVVIDPVSNTDKDAILFKAVEWGRVGDLIEIGYFYPTAADRTDVSSDIEIGDTLKFKFYLKSGGELTSNIDAATEWDVSVISTTGGIDIVEYAWNNQGADPLLSASLPSNYVTINQTGEFDAANTGTYKITASTATSFRVSMPTGQAVAENNIGSLTASTITFYEKDDTSAQDIVDYVTNNLSSWLTAEAIDDNGTDGSGIILLSTHQDNDFAANEDYIELVDGERVISVSDLDATGTDAQFTFNKALDMESFSTNTADAYEFRNGTEIRLVPVNAKQVSDLMKALPVTGLTTKADVMLVDSDSKIQIATRTFGSAGAVQVASGTGNYAVANVNGIANTVSNSSNTIFSVPIQSALGFHGGQWVKLTATNYQRKATGINALTNITITPNSPALGYSTIELGGAGGATFGEPRHVYTKGGAFHIEPQGKLTCLSWDNVTGTGIDITNVREGDSVILGSRFSSINQGTYRVVRRFNNSIYFEHDSVLEERVVDVANEINLGNGADKNPVGIFTISVNADGNMVITSTDADEFADAAPGQQVSIGNGTPFANAANQGEFIITEATDSYIVVNNTAAVAEVATGVITNTGTDYFYIHDASLKFYDYDAVIPDDKFSITSDILGSGNTGTHTITGVMSPSKLVVDGTLTATTNFLLDDNFAQVYVEERDKYVGYKRILNKFMNTSSSSYASIIVEGQEDIGKINQVSGVSMTALSKINFVTSITAGVDAYKYHTGLIGEVNRITYGDPRDPITNPGVAAAGAEIFIQPPLFKSIKVSVSVRVKTGIPFSVVSERVRNNIESLIKSNPVGQSIPISDIISSINIIPGVQAVSISSPAYSTTNDMIVVNPSEKALVLDSTSDILISKVE